MAKKVIYNNDSGDYFIDGDGFVAPINEATQFDAAEANALAKAFARFGDDIEVLDAPENADGEGIEQNADGSSFAVSFIRPADLAADGGVRPNKNNPSKRRFKTREEADQHGSRFVESLGHLGFYVTEVREPVNAWVNWETGLTNPEIGKQRIGGKD